MTHVINLYCCRMMVGSVGTRWRCRSLCSTCSVTRSSSITSLYTAIFFYQMTEMYGEQKISDKRYTPEQWQKVICSLLLLFSKKWLKTMYASEWSFSSNSPFDLEGSLWTNKRFLTTPLPLCRQAHVAWVLFQKFHMQPLWEEGTYRPCLL